MRFALYVRRPMTPFDAPSPSLPDGPARPLARLRDAYARTVSYLRLSVTDRCDLRCVYCMSEHMRFLPKAEVLSLEELERLSAVFIASGVRKVRLTGGEPLVRKGLMGLVGALGRRAARGDIDEVTLTTNGARLAAFVPELASLGVRRINVSLDTLEPDLFRRITRGGDLAAVLAGIETARAAGISIKLNTVALAGDDAAEIPRLIAWAHERGLDITLIEAMPMGEIEADRATQYLSLADVRRDLEGFWTLRDLAMTTGGPARYVEVAETGGRLGFITPLSHTFCDGCNRVRVTCTGVMHTCLGQADATDLRGPLRAGASDTDLAAIIAAGVAAKSRGHDFRIAPGAAPAVARHMSTTGG
jgi:cyclic pyranopterin phosphate synthase